MGSDCLVWTRDEEFEEKRSYYITPTGQSELVAVCGVSYGVGLQRKLVSIVDRPETLFCFTQSSFVITRQLRLLKLSLHTYSIILRTQFWTAVHFHSGFSCLQTYFSYNNFKGFKDSPKNMKGCPMILPQNQYKLNLTFQYFVLDSYRWEWQIKKRDLQTLSRDEKPSVWACIKSIYQQGNLTSVSVSLWKSKWAAAFKSFRENNLIFRTEVHFLNILV